MEKYFVPYEESVELSKLGFDEYCDGRYYDTYKTLWNSEGGWFNRACSAPIYAQAFNWIKYTYGLEVMYTASIPVSYIPHIFFYSEKGLDYKCMEMLRFFDRKCFDTKEEADLESLRKLIEIIKKKD